MTEMQYHVRCLDCGEGWWVSCRYTSFEELLVRMREVWSKTCPRCGDWMKTFTKPTRQFVWEERNTTRGLRKSA